MVCVIATADRSTDSRHLPVPSVSPGVAAGGVWRRIRLGSRERVRTSTIRVQSAACCQLHHPGVWISAAEANRTPVMTLEASGPATERLPRESVAVPGVQGGT